MSDQPLPLPLPLQGGPGGPPDDLSDIWPEGYIPIVEARYKVPVVIIEQAKYDDLRAQIASLRAEIERLTEDNQA